MHEQHGDWCAWPQLFTVGSCGANGSSTAYHCADETRPFCGKTLGHERAVGESDDENPIGGDALFLAELFDECFEKAEIVDFVLPSTTAAELSVPTSLLARFGFAGVGVDNHRVGAKCVMQSRVVSELTTIAAVTMQPNHQIPGFWIAAFGHEETPSYSVDLY